VGTLRRLFAGPGDQLTRVWFDGFVDSIGNVNPEVRWGFDQRGRLKADTAFTGTLARATSHAYDAFERPNATTDPLGMWSVRYETSRGYLDTLITPFGDTIRYVFDAQSRAKGPFIAGGGPLEDRVPLWNDAGALSRVTHTVWTGTNWVAGKYDRHNFFDKGGPPLVPTWSEQHGAGTPTVSIEDSLRHDGWERITAIVTRLNGSTVIQRDTFAFDRVGNLHTTAGAETYDPVTNRLLSRSTPAGIRHYRYDRAGNLTRDSLADGTQTWAFGYDALNRTRSARRNGVLIVRYAYDVFGQRIVKRVYSSASGGTVAYTRFVYRRGHVAFETDSAGNLGLRYTWGPGTDNLMAVRDAAGNHFYASTDPLGSIRGLVKRDGTWVMSQRFGAYGALIGKDSAGSGPGFLLRYAWTGRELDTETGLYFFRSRYYDPSARRFVQEDAIGYGGSLNLYAYGDGNPTNGRDPDGLKMDDMVYAGDGLFGPRPSRGGAGGGNGVDWDGNGIDDFEEFADDVWASQRSGLSLAELDYYRGIGATSVQIGVRSGNITTIVAEVAIPHEGDPFVAGPTIRRRDPALHYAGGRPPDPLGEYIFAVTTKFAGHPASVSGAGITQRGAVLEGTWYRTTPTIFGQRYTMYQGYWNGYKVHGDITVSAAVLGRTAFWGYVFPGWMPGSWEPIWLGMY
jgi:RHS repeat-associated protein